MPADLMDDCVERRAICVLICSTDGVRFLLVPGEDSDEAAVALGSSTV